MTTPTLPAALPAEAASAPESAALRKQGMAALTLGAIGVVYGDIGTSPLYTVKEIFAPHTGVPLDALHLIGAVSTIIWALMLVVTLKYVILILRADNHGEGGGLALTALAAKAVQDRPALRQEACLLLGVFGATLFYGDSVITPAISVLGAMEGWSCSRPRSSPMWCPSRWPSWWGCSFSCSASAPAVVGRFFGPIIVSVVRGARCRRRAAHRAAAGHPGGTQPGCTPGAS